MDHKNNHLTSAAHHKTSVMLKAAITTKLPTLNLGGNSHRPSSDRVLQHHLYIQSNLYLHKIMLWKNLNTTVFITGIQLILSMPILAVDSDV